MQCLVGRNQAVGLAVKSVRRAHGAWATNWALQQMGRDEDMRLVDEEFPPRDRDPAW
jgi:hypothetical protein